MSGDALLENGNRANCRNVRL